MRIGDTGVCPSNLRAFTSAPKSARNSSCHESGPVIAPLKRLLADGWEQINLRRAEYAIRKKIEGTNLHWKGWYGFRRGMATNLFELGVRPEEAALILRNSPEVVRRHYIKLEQAGKKIDAMACLEQAYDERSATVQ
jgi:hypothetical protein